MPVDRRTHTPQKLAAQALGHDPAECLRNAAAPAIPQLCDLRHHTDLVQPAPDGPIGHRRNDRRDVETTGGPCQKGIKVTAAEMKTLDISGDPFHPE